MSKNHALALGLVVGVCLVAPTAVVADWYEDFNDRSFWQGEPNTVWHRNDPWPAFDPNLYDIDNPHWWFFGDLVSLGTSVAEIHESALIDKGMRLFATPPILAQQIAFLATMVGHHEALDPNGEDPNISPFYWDDTTNHYILTKVYYAGDVLHYDPNDPNTDPDDPNNDKGSAFLLLHGNEAVWQSFGLEWAFHNCAYRLPGEYHSREIETHYTQSILLTSINGTTGANMQRVWIDPNGVRDPNFGDPNDPSYWASADPNDTTWLQPPEPHRRRDPNYDDTKWLGVDLDGWERDGFWAVLQFEQDPNSDTGDPKGKFLRAAVWSGGKYDWDGEWLLSQECSDPYWTGGVDANELYWAEGRSGMAAASFDGDNWGAGFPADMVYDDLEARTGVFTNTSRALTLERKDCTNLTVDPDRLDDPNGDPNDPDLLRRYTDGTGIVLHSVVPVGNKAFKKWKIMGPNDTGDPLYQIVSDTNEVLYLTMDGDYEVKAVCKCGGSIEPFAGMVLLVLGLGVMVRRMS